MKNIVIIVADSLRKRDLSIYKKNSKNINTNIHKISKECFVFENAFSSTNSTIPSLISLFSGEFPQKRTINQRNASVSKNIFWLPTYLKNRGYSTIGIDYLGNYLKKDFQKFYGQKENIVDKTLQLPLIREIVSILPKKICSLGKKTLKKDTSSFPEAIKNIDTAVSKIKKTQTPFFLFLHLWDTHFPFETTDFSKKGFQFDKILDKISHPGHKKYVKERLNDIALDNLEDIKAKRDLSIQKIDVAVGKFIDFLKKEKLWENTIFILLSDHGENFGEHGIYFSHSGLYEETLQIPLIIHIPGEKGKVIKKNVQNIHITPAIISLLENKKINKNTFLFSDKTKKLFFMDNFSKNGFAIRNKNKKLIKGGCKCSLCKEEHHKKFEEYDLEKDPNENNNIFNERNKLKNAIRNVK
jgi:arylsulfatase A-like enzyme